MADLEKGEQQKGKNFWFVILRYSVAGLIGICFGFLFNWLYPDIFTTRNTCLIKTKSKDSYDSFDKCPPLNCSGVQVQNFSYNTTTKKCVYEYEVDVD